MTQTHMFLTADDRTNTDSALVQIQSSEEGKFVSVRINTAVSGGVLVANKLLNLTSLLYLFLRFSFEDFLHPFNVERFRDFTAVSELAFRSVRFLSSYSHRDCV